LSTRVDSVEAPSPAESASGVIGNARITGAFGATIFVLLFLEGITVLRVQQLISMHVFVGMLLVPFVIVKMTSTGYRFVRYYGGDRAYVEKGAPPLLLRALGPVVVATTIALFATGIAALLSARRNQLLLTAHKASFILWFGAMTVHVLGHILETPALAIADVRAAERGRAPRAATRALLLVLALATGIMLGFISLGWVHHWQTVRRF
jgi:hypothetical protein